VQAFEAMFVDAASKLPRPNNFLEDDEYTVRKACVVAMSRVHARNGATPMIVIETLRNALENNDNTYNKADDSHYLCMLLTALGRVRLSSDFGNSDRHLKEVIRVVSVQCHVG
jgi:hypothetical protein